jgi:hypothetical protein
MAINSSRTLYANKRDIIEKLVTDLHAPSPAPEKAKKPGEGSPYAKRPVPTTSTPPLEVRSPKKFEAPKQVDARMSVSIEQKPPVFERKPEIKKPHTAAVKSPDDLRSILSKMSQTQHSGQKVEGTLKQKEDKTEPAAKTDLKNALASVMNQMPAELKSLEKIVEIKPAERIIPHPPKIHPKSTHDDSIGATSQPVPLTQERRAVPSFSPSPESTIDESVVKRMLREEKQGRSPFT